MSILRTYNVQNPDSTSVNIELSAAGGVNVAGVSTFSTELQVGTGVTISDGSISATGVSTFSNGIIVAAGSTESPAISPSGDSNTGIFFPAPDTVAVSYGGTEVLRVDSSGRIGVGPGIGSTTITDNLFVYNPNGWSTLGLKPAASNASAANIYRPFGATSVSNPEFFIGKNYLNAADGKLHIWRYTTSHQTSDFIIDSSGRVTMPYQPMFYAYQSSSSFTTSTGIFNSTQWNSTAINVGNHFNTSNGRFTAPIAGKYVFYGKGIVRWNTGAGSLETTLYKNGSNVTSRGLAYDYMVAASDHATQFFMYYLDLVAGDYIQYGIHAKAAGTDLYYGQNLGSFSGRLIG